MDPKSAVGGPKPISRTGHVALDLAAAISQSFSGASFTVVCLIEKGVRAIAKMQTCNAMQ